MLSAPMDNVENMQQQMVSVIRDGHTKKDSKEMLEIRNANKNQGCL